MCTKSACLVRVYTETNFILPYMSVACMKRKKKQNGFSHLLSCKTLWSPMEHLNVRGAAQAHPNERQHEDKSDHLDAYLGW